MLSIADAVPDFELPGTSDRDEKSSYRLSDALERGPVVLVFYPFDFHPACTDQLCTLRDFGWLDIRPDVTVFGVGPDSVYSHREYRQSHGFDFTLLSDSDRRVTAKYDVETATLEGHREVPRRTVYVIDDTGRVRYRWQSTGPDAETDIEEVVNSLKA